MELTDYRLYEKICIKLRNWVLPLPWPVGSVDILKFANSETKKILPYIVTANNLWSGREDLVCNYPNNPSVQWLLNDAGKSLAIKFTHWISNLKFIVEPIYYATYHIETNRTVNTWHFTPQSLLSNFGFGKKEDSLITLRYFCYYIGSPLTTIQRRELGGKHVYILCTPKDLVGHAT